MTRALPTSKAVPRVALLRGVNVGAKKVAMADLRRLAADLGFEDVATLINSGNLVYVARGTAAHDDERQLHEAIARELGVRCTVFVRSRDELAAMLAECPLPAEAERDPSRLLVTVWNDALGPDMLRAFVAAAESPERFAAGERALYCWLPNGISASVPYEKASRRLGEHITARNWSTMKKLLARLDALTLVHGGVA